VRRLSINATGSTIRHKGKSVNQGNSGTVGDGLGELLTEGMVVVCVVFEAGIVIVCVMLQVLFLLMKFIGRFMFESSTGGNQPPAIAITLKSMSPPLGWVVGSIIGVNGSDITVY
jgi:hypothetical protein